jgi:phosphopentomutase
MTRFRRIALIVLDSVGIGAMPDAAGYGDDPSSDTLGNLARRRPLKLPNLQRLGLANLKPLEHLEPVAAPAAAHGRCALRSPGKDTTTGHWEIAGILLEKPFPLYPNGFPAEIINEFERLTGRGTLGNKPASGTEIIRELGEEHLRTGRPIIYTSADSVFQIAAHEDVIPLAELYRMCEIARGILRGPHEVGRVIARPFVGEPGAFRRTSNRHDYAVPPQPGMLLDKLSESGIAVSSIGKISDVYLGRGITSSRKTKNNADGMAQTLEALAALDRGLLFTNLVDFDQLFGHRNDPEGYSRALEEVDEWVPKLEAALRRDDLVVFTADHGCDPTTASTDHSREYVPLLAFGPGVTPSNLGTRESLADVGQTIAENFGVRIAAGQSFLPFL